MNEFLAIDFLIKLFYALITLVMFFAVLRYRDKVIGIKFKESFKRIEKDGKALAIYFGSTSIAVAIIISSFF